MAASVAVVADDWFALSALVVWLVVVEGAACVTRAVALLLLLTRDALVLLCDATLLVGDVLLDAQGWWKSKFVADVAADLGGELDEREGWKRDDVAGGCGGLLVGARVVLLGGGRSSGDSSVPGRAALVDDHPAVVGEGACEVLDTSVAEAVLELGAEHAEEDAPEVAVALGELLVWIFADVVGTQPRDAPDEREEGVLVDVEGKLALLELFKLVSVVVAGVDDDVLKVGAELWPRVVVGDKPLHKGRLGVFLGGDDLQQGLDVRGVLDGGVVDGGIEAVDPAYKVFDGVVCQRWKAGRDLHAGLEVAACSGGCGHRAGRSCGVLAVGQRKLRTKRRRRKRTKNFR